MEANNGWIGHNTGDCISCREVIDGFITGDVAPGGFIGSGVED